MTLSNVEKQAFNTSYPDARDQSTTVTLEQQASISKNNNVFNQRGRSMNLTTLQAGLLFPVDAAKVTERSNQRWVLPNITNSKKRMFNRREQSV